MTVSNLEGKMKAAGGALRMLRTSPVGPYPFPIRSEYSNWRDEQRAWRETSILYEQHAMGSDMYFKGPDVKRLFSDVATNSFAKFDRNGARRLVTVSPDGYFIGEDVLIALEDDEYDAVGSLYASNWLQYCAQSGGYDVECFKDAAIPLGAPGKKRLFRFIIQGPTALETVRKASLGALPEIKFYRVGEFEVAGQAVRALNHTMSGVPGQEHTGLEVYGPIEGVDQVRDAILRAGEEFGMRQGGAISYPTATVESGWFPQPLPAIYHCEDMRPYREWLGLGNLEVFGSMGGSFVSDRIEDYYVTPWELGYHKAVSSDHDFIGKEALFKKRDETSRTQVWLRWNEDDVARIIASSLNAPTAEGAKYLHIPTPTYATYHYDAVLVKDERVGISSFAAFTVNISTFASLAVIDKAHARDGAEVVVVWGEPAGGSNRPVVERHMQTEIRATVRTQSPA